MAYQEQITRINPSCFIFLIDQSGSMLEKYNIGLSKSQAVADTINRLLSQLIIRSSSNDGIRNYFHISVIGYGDNRVQSAFGGALKGKMLVPLSEINANPVRVEKRTKKIPDGAGGLIEIEVNFPLWFDPIADGGTPMKQAFGEVNKLVATWVKEHPNSFPPTVIHITDGATTDGDPLKEMEAVKNHSTSDGNVILFNLHTSTTSANQLVFPSDEVSLPGDNAKMLFEGASILPPYIQSAAVEEGFNVSSSSRGYVFNADLDVIIRAIEIGTKASNMLALPSNSSVDA